MSSFDATGMSRGTLYFSASFAMAFAQLEVYGPTMPVTLSRVASFSKAAIDLSGFPVSSSLMRSTSIPSFFRSSTASVTPLERFSPIGASAPVMELTKPSLTFFAGAASEKYGTIRKVAAMSRTRFTAMTAPPCILKSGQRITPILSLRGAMHVC